MVIKVGVNGLGRIGRCVIRAWAESNRKDVEIVAVNFRRDVPEKVHLLKYDSTHGVYQGEIKGTDDAISIDGKKMKVFHHADPAEIKWSDAGVDIVLECTGVFTEKEAASKHLQGGAKKVLISAPSGDADAMVVYGVNNEVVKPDYKVMSIGSCTTNCLAPIVKVMDELCGIENGFMTTVHSYTSDQNLLDNNHRDLRRARSAALSMIPTSTGAAKSLGIVFPNLKGKLDGVSIRVPTPNVSFVDFTFNAKKGVTKDEVNAAMKKAASGALKGVVSICDEPLVSIDFIGDTHSAIFDTSGTIVIGDKLVRVGAWYDNEWGFSNRMLDVAALVG